MHVSTIRGPTLSLFSSVAYMSCAFKHSYTAESAVYEYWRVHPKPLSVKMARRAPHAHLP